MDSNRLNLKCLHIKHCFGQQIGANIAWICARESVGQTTERGGELSLEKASDKAAHPYLLSSGRAENFPTRMLRGEEINNDFLESSGDGYNTYEALDFGAKVPGMEQQVPAGFLACPNLVGQTSHRASRLCTS